MSCNRHPAISYRLRLAWLFGPEGVELSLPEVEAEPNGLAAESREVAFVLPAGDFIDRVDVGRDGIVFGVAGDWVHRFGVEDFCFYTASPGVGVDVELGAGYLDGFCSDAAPFDTAFE